MLINALSRRRPAAILAASGVLALVLFLLMTGRTHAQELSGEAQFILNTFSFLIWGALVMWMCAGFTMLESGSVRTKNASMICLKNIGLYSIAGLAYFFIGYNLMYVDLVGGVIGSFNLLYGPTAGEIALVGGDGDAAAVVADAGYATMADWFFQMVFVATAASIVSGALAERVRMWTFFAFVVALTAFIYPVVGAWTWGGGWLAELGFQDFAGSTIVHGVGGWAALAGILVVGPRLGKFRADGTPRPTPPSNILVVTLGVFILWLGWFGFNGGSQLALGSAADAVAMSHVLVNTNLAACAGVMAALGASRYILGRMDLFAGLNGAIAGLVSITAGPDITEHYWAVIIGAVGGLGLHGRAEAVRAAAARRRGGGGAGAPLRRHLGHARRLHRRGRRPRPAARRHRGDRRVRLHRVVGAVARARPRDRRARGAGRRAPRPRRGRTRHRGLPRVRAHAGGAVRRSGLTPPPA